MIMRMILNIPTHDGIKYDDLSESEVQKIELRFGCKIKSYYDDDGWYFDEKELQIDHDEIPDMPEWFLKYVIFAPIKEN